MMNSKILKRTLFFLVGIVLFWYVYRNFDILSINDALKGLKFKWIILSVILGLISHIVRALRWGMLIKPMGYKPKTINLFLSVLVLYFINLVIPRGGELARCAVITKSEKIPFVKLLGTVFIERVTDFIAFIIIFSVVLVWQFRIVEQLFYSLTLDFSHFQSKTITLGIAASLILIFYVLSKRFGLLKRFAAKIHKVQGDIMEGFKSILQIRNKWTYLSYTILIFMLWSVMFYVIYLAYPPTSNLPFSSAIFAYTIGTFAYLLPIQAGIGVWHFLIIESLFLFGLDKESGMMFALIAHTFTDLIYLVFGTLSFMIIPLIKNRG